MDIKNLKKYIILCIIMIVTSSCASSYCAVKDLSRTVEEKLPRQSFALIQNSLDLKACKSIGTNLLSACQTATLGSASSGMFVGRSKIDSTVGYVLTAGHSCDAQGFKKRYDKPDVIITVEAQRMNIVTYHGQSYPATIVKINHQYDMCLLQVHGIGDHPAPVRVSETPPVRTQKSYNIAAPLGIFNTKMVFMFKGLFSGYNKQGYALYTLPTKPGSSGSSILNADGEIIGMIFAGYRGIESIAISSPHHALKAFIEDNIKMGELALHTRQKMLEARILDLIR